ncbi:MlaD family protein [Prauserella flavalba]|uniref:MlaD family protein n=1 Tax=Prauserella flavalba TaxID=1477506 RepID=UPI0036E98B70
MNRLAVVQLALFAVIGLACSYYVATSVLGPAALRDPLTVTVRMPDTGGATIGSQVTYRGVGVGEVADVRIAENGTGVEVALSVDPDSRIPADATAVVTMDSPLAILRVDLRPVHDNPPYLADGAVIEGEHTRRPLPLETLLEDFMALADTLPADDVAVVGEALATGLSGAAPELTRTMDNVSELLRLADERMPQLQRIIDNGRLLAGTAGGGRLRELTSALRSLTGTLRGNEPAIRTLLHDVPEPTRQVVALMRENEPALATLLGNLVSTTQLVGMRAPAVEQLLTSMPRAFRELGGIVEGDTANFYLVGTQGPVCYNDTPRRPPTAIAPRDPVLTWNCAPGNDLQQRGSLNAPRPGGTPAPVPAYDAVSGREMPFQLGATGGQSSVLGPRSWSSILLQGVQ